MEPAATASCFGDTLGIPRPGSFEGRACLLFLPMGKCSQARTPILTGEKGATYLPEVRESQAADCHLFLLQGLDRQLAVNSRRALLEQAQGFLHLTGPPWGARCPPPPCPVPAPLRLAFGWLLRNPPNQSAPHSERASGQSFQQLSKPLCVFLLYLWALGWEQWSTRMTPGLFWATDCRTRMWPRYAGGSAEKRAG